MFTPGANGKKGRGYKVINSYYPEEFKTKMDEDCSKYDYSVIEIEEDLEAKYGYLGIDMREENTEKVQNIEVCGYPGDKERHTMWHASGKYITNEFFFYYSIRTSQGQSGSPIIKNKNGREYVVGVHIGSNFRKTKNIAIKLTP